MVIRLDRFLSNNTILTRKEIHKVIRQKRVLVNNVVVTDFSTKIDSDKDEIVFDGNIINSLKNIYLALNKPKGYISSNKSSDLYPCIFELLNDYFEYDLHIIGRLDQDTTGLIIITNDGKFSHYLKNPKNNIEKEYEVTLKENITDEMLKRLSQPIRLDGKLLKPFILKNINKNKLNIVLTEGKYHEIKRIFNVVKNDVVELKRIRIAKLNLANLKLKLGNYKEISISNII